MSVDGSVELVFLKIITYIPVVEFENVILQDCMEA